MFDIISTTKFARYLCLLCIETTKPEFLRHANGTTVSLEGIVDLTTKAHPTLNRMVRVLMVEAIDQLHETDAF